VSARVLVETPAGPIVGEVENGTRRFLGVPYAAAPIGPLRFAAPQPRPRFSTPFEATRHGATPQRVPLFATTTIPEPSVPGDDTLNLEIFAPAACAGAPILFWIHGGGYIAGSHVSPWYDGSTFAREGVIVVDASYRLGVDGFGVIPGAPGNRGLRDLLLALRWVRDNAAAFGGDPDRITIAGQSAGGGAVLALVSSPAAAGLFRAAVSVSGVDLSYSAELGRQATVAIARELGCEPTADGFGPSDDGSAMGAILRMRDAGATESPTPLGPVHGDDVLPVPIPVGLRSIGTDIPLLLGSTADEFDGGPTPEDPDRPDPRGPEALAARAAGTRVTDTLFRAACIRAAAARVEVSATWLYSFDWPSPIMLGATHCIDVPFLFGNLDAVGVSAALGADPPPGLESAMHGDILAVVRGEEPSWPRARGEVGDFVRVYGADGVATTARGSYDPCVPHSAEDA
jgi:para-nitrobenzyl esterase